MKFSAIVLTLIASIACAAAFPPEEDYTAMRERMRNAALDRLARSKEPISDAANAKETVDADASKIAFDVLVFEAAGAQIPVVNAAGDQAPAVDAAASAFLEELSEGSPEDAFQKDVEAAVANSLRDAQEAQAAAGPEGSFVGEDAPEDPADPKPVEAATGDEINAADAAGDEEVNVTGDVISNDPSSISSTGDNRPYTLTNLYNNIKENRAATAGVVITSIATIAALRALFARRRIRTNNSTNTTDITATNTINSTNATTISAPTSIVI